jgi:hypothetical protein
MPPPIPGLAFPSPRSPSPIRPSSYILSGQIEASGGVRRWVTLAGVDEGGFTGDVPPQDPPVGGSAGHTLGASGAMDHCTLCPSHRQRPEAAPCSASSAPTSVRPPPPAALPPGHQSPSFRYTSSLTPVLISKLCSSPT